MICGICGRNLLNFASAVRALEADDPEQLHSIDQPRAKEEWYGSCIAEPFVFKRNDFFNAKKEGWYVP